MYAANSARRIHAFAGTTLTRFVFRFLFDPDAQKVLAFHDRVFSGGGIESPLHGGEAFGNLVAVPIFGALAELPRRELKALRRLDQGPVLFFGAW
jgi:hypothetical protein